MRNLKTIRYRKCAVEAGSTPTASAWDTSNNTIICAFGPTPTNPVIELKRRAVHQDSTEEFVSITSWDSPCPLPDLECDEILLLQHFSDTATSCLVLAGGDVVVVREDPLPDQEKIEIVGSVDVGICAAVWASDEEILAIVTRADTLVLMSRTFEPLNEATLSADDLRISKQVSVGWGQRETQFQGRRAKAMRDPTVPEKVDTGDPSPFEDGKVSLSWRGDGQYVAINSVVKEHRRVIRVFTREAVLDSASEPVDGMESALSWKPTGQLIAGVKRHSTKVEIIMFERNGLRHGGFDLRLTTDDMNTWASSISLAWNNDSSVLAVSFKDRVQLWTMNNYHYYLNQEIPLESQQAASPVIWHAETPLRFTFRDASHVYDLTLLSSIHCGSTIPPYDHGVVGVIDGMTLKLTPFKQAGVPPPMAFCELVFKHNITDFAFSRNSQRIAVLTTNTLELCEWKTREDSKGALRFMSTADTHSVQLPNSNHYTQIALANEDVIILAPGLAGSMASCQKLRWTGDSKNSTGKHIQIPKTAECLIADSTAETVFVTVASSDTTIRLSDAATEYASGLSGLSGCQPDSSIFALPHTELNQPNGYVNGDIITYHKVSLTPKGNLYVDGVLLVREVTSYILTSGHLIFTTSTHLLKFVHLTHDPHTMQAPPDTPEIDERCRNIERGGKIVTVIPSIYAVILQMPRGNLETIYPRLLVVSGIREHLKQQDYLTAFLACQTHQVDMNILYDYNPESFLSSITAFIDQLKKPGRIGEFLSKLKEEDVTKTLYRDTTLSIDASTQLQTPIKPLPGTKVNRIADAFLEALASKPSPTYLQTIITAHVCKSPPDLSSALALVSSLLKSSAENGKTQAETAISHLFFLTPNPTLLFDASLGTYDLELTLLVAENDTSRDPREYMPFLESLNELTPLRRQYTIENHLKKYEKALSSLHALEEHEKVKAYVVKHSLYNTALDLYKYDTAGHLRELTRLYAEFLSTQKSQHSHAAMLYESLGDHDSAYPLYALAHKWREALTCASLVPLPRDQLESLAHSLATTMTDENRDYRAAATICTDYLHNPTEAARLLCRGSYFSDALRLMSLHNLATEIPNLIDTSLTDKLGEILELLADCRSQLTAQLPRIADLRTKKAEDPLAFFGGDAAEAEGADIPDNISLAATDASTLGGQSLFTRYGSNASKFGGTVASNVSRKTSKTKRREERKRARGKKGSVYEEEYLVASVFRLIERVNGLHEEVGRLVSGLMRRGMREQAKRVEEGMLEIVRACEKAKVDVWGEPVEKENEVQGTYEVDGSGRPAGADGVFWDSQQEVDKKEAPEVKAWNSHELL